MAQECIVVAQAHILVAQAYTILEHCFATSEVSMRFPELICFCQNQQKEIYHFRVVPDLQISKKVELLMIYMSFSLFSNLFIVASEVPRRFLELRFVLSESEKRDLQF